MNPTKNVGETQVLHKVITSNSDIRIANLKNPVNVERVKNEISHLCKGIP